MLAKRVEICAAGTTTAREPVAVNLFSTTDAAWSCGSTRNPRDARLATGYRADRSGKGIVRFDISSWRACNRSTRALFARLHRPAFQAQIQEFPFPGEKGATAPWPGHV